MQWNDLKRKKEAPSKGWILAYTRKEVLFHPYKSYKELEQELAGIDLLEMHLFDKEKEYRCLLTRSKRFPDGVIETVENFEFKEENQKDVYQEEILIPEILLSKDKNVQKITVLNHISYNEENGMATVDNYRLKI